MFPPLYLSRTCSVFAPLRFRHFPRRSFVTTLLSLLILIDATSRACLSPPTELAVFFYSALSARMHHVRPSLCLEPRSPFFSPSRCIHLFSLTLVARQHHVALHVSVPLSRMSRCQSASLTTSLRLSRISLRIFALDIARWLIPTVLFHYAARHHAGLFAPFSTARTDISFVPHLPHRPPTSPSLYVKLSEFSPVWIYFASRNRMYVFIQTCPISSATQGRLCPSLCISLFLIYHK